MNSHSAFFKKLDIFLLIIFPIFSVLISLALKANFLTSILLFYGLPSLWLSLRTPNRVAKTLIFTSLLTPPFGLIVDYIETINHSWFIPQTSFSFRVFGVIPIKDLIWGFFVVYSTIIFYEHFLDKGKHQLVDKRLKLLIWPLFSALTIFLVTLSSKLDIFIFRYAYLWLGLLLVFLPSITFLSFFPRLISKYIKTASYFFYSLFIV